MVRKWHSLTQPSRKTLPNYVDYITARGGEVHMNSPLRQINLVKTVLLKVLLPSLDGSKKS